MRVAFMGTPEFAVPSLRALHESARHELLCAVTRPDEPKGRGLKAAPPPVKQAALELGLPVLQPEGALSPALFPSVPDVAVVVAYGRILPKEFLEYPARGCVNVHASLLPRWRGASPVAAAIRAGDKVTGVTTMRIAERLDAGGILLQHACEISPRETAGELHDRLALMGAELLVETLNQMEEGGLAERPQDESRASYAPRLKKSDGLVDWNMDAAALDCHVRAMTPWPGAFSYLKGRTVKILRGGPSDAPSAGAMPGTLLPADGEALPVACGGGVYRIEEIQPEGRRPMTGRAFLDGRHGSAGDRFSAGPGPQ